MNLLTHVFAGLAISECLNLNLLTVVLGSVLPDLDYLLGVEHRTIMHSLLFLIIITFFAYKRSRRAGLSLFIGLSSHLILDVLTTQGIMLLWPNNTFYTFSLFNSSNTSINLLVIITCLILLWNSSIIREKLQSFNSKSIRITTLFLLTAPLILAVPYTWQQISNCEPAILSVVLENAGEYNNKCITLQGKTCSLINDYTSAGGADYKIFTLCNGNETINVWVLSAVAPSLEINNNITITGVFTTKFLDTTGYEIYMIKSLRKD